MRARDHVADRRYVYVPGSLPRDAIGRVWNDLRPHETVVAHGEQDALPPVSLERVRHRVQAGVPVLHLVSTVSATTAWPWPARGLQLDDQVFELARVVGHDSAAI